MILKINSKINYYFNEFQNEKHFEKQLLSLFQTPLISLINYRYEWILFDGVKFDYIHEQNLANYLGYLMLYQVRNRETRMI